MINHKFYFNIISVLLLFISCNNRAIDTCEKFNKFQSIKRTSIDTLTLLSITAEVLKKDPGSLDALLTRGDIFSSLDNADSAKLAYMKAISFYPSNVYALYQLGILYEDLKANDSAAYYFNLALQKKVKDSAFIDYSVSLKGLNDKDAKYDIPTIELIYQKGMCSYYLRDLELAIKYFDLCLSNNYLPGQTYLYKGAIYFEMNNRTEACENFKKALENGNEDANDYLNKYCK